MPQNVHHVILQTDVAARFRHMSQHEKNVELHAQSKGVPSACENEIFPAVGMSCSEKIRLRIERCKERR